MAVDRCPKCGGTDLKANTSGRLRNSHHCNRNDCGHDFPLWATGSIVAILFSGVTFLKTLVDEAKELLGGGPRDDHPQPAQPEARAAIPPPQPHASQSPRRLAEPFVLRGHAHCRAEEWDQAIKFFDQAIQIDPDYADAFLYRGSAYARKHDYSRALSDLDAALGLNPNSADAYFERGVARLQFLYSKIGSHYLVNGEKIGGHDRIFEDLNKAIELFGDAIEYKPAKAHAFYNRARAHRDEDRLARVIDDTTEAIRLNPNFDAAFMLRGDAKRMTGDAKGADADAARAKQLRRRPRADDARREMESPQTEDTTGSGGSTPDGTGDGSTAGPGSLR
jgi:tetratricopeptide (TPR) repeat protein